MIDVVTQYADQVISGEIKAGPHVKAQCIRHMDDLARDDLIWDPAAANDGIDRLQTKFTLGGDPFAMFLWQKFCVGSIYGWKRLDGRRRFRRAYWETGKGSGKTPLAAAVALEFCFGEGEKRAEGFVSAKTMEQALVTYRDAAAFVDDSPVYNTEDGSQPLRIMGLASPYNIIDPETGSFFKRLAANESGAGRSGYRPHVAVIDEYHEHASSSMVDMMVAGVKARKQPLILITTNAGAGMGSACGVEHRYAIQVAHQERKDDTYFPYVCALDDGDDIEDESNWIKTNPSLTAKGLSLPGYEYIRNMLQQSKGVPSRRALVERLQFCRWSDAVDPWLDAEVLDDAWTESLDCGGEAFAAIDLSSRRDLTAGALVWAMPDGTFEAEVTLWTPEDTLPAREVTDQAPYLKWAEQGYLQTIPGEVMDFEPVAAWLQNAADAGLTDAAYDPWRIDELVRELEKIGVLASRYGEIGVGVTLHPHPQGFVARGKSGLSMSVSIDMAEQVLLQRRIKIKANPAVRSAILGSAVIKDASGNRRLNKSKSTTRIDGAIALIMAIGLAVSLAGQGMSGRALNMMGGLPAKDKQ